LKMSPQGVSDSIFEQVLTFGKIASNENAPVIHVKPHGALYNQAVRDLELAQAIADGVARWSKKVVLMGLAGSQMLEVFRKAGFTVAAEAFADRRYEPDGSLRSRKFEDSLLRNPADAARQALRIVEQGSVIASDGSEVFLKAQTICIHGDTPGAPQIAAAVASTLRGTGVQLKPLG
jgi:5-oxoprolinase (ATP-hydrolysing) subunit A